MKSYATPCQSGACHRLVVFANRNLSSVLNRAGCCLRPGIPSGAIYRVNSKPSTPILDELLDTFPAEAITVRYIHHLENNGRLNSPA